MNTSRVYNLVTDHDNFKVIYILLYSLYLISFPFVSLQHNMTALIWACGRGHTGVVSELINRGAKAEVADKVAM